MPTPKLTPEQIAQRQRAISGGPGAGAGGLVGHIDPFGAEAQAANRAAIQAQVARGQISQALANQLFQQAPQAQTQAVQQAPDPLAAERAQQGLEAGRLGLEQGRLGLQQGRFDLERGRRELALREQLLGRIGGQDVGTAGMDLGDSLGLRARLQRQLEEAERPIDVQGDEEIRAFRLAQQRAAERARGELAARAQAEGLGSGAFQSELAKIGEQRGIAEGAFEAGQIGKLRQQRAARLREALGQAIGFQGGAEERNLRRRLAEMQARAGLRTQLVQGVIG